VDDNTVNWKNLLRLAVTFLRNANIPNDKWTFGGGTLLRFYYNHRISNDIDIFLFDPQYIGFVTPRLNDEVANAVTDYTEMSNFLTLILKEGKIDYVVAANLTGLKSSIIQINDMFINAEQPEEVIVKKMFYRADTFKMRDVIDTMVVIRDRGDSLSTLVKKICFSKIDIILDRIKSLESIDLEEVYLIDKTISKKESTKIVSGFLLKIKKELEQCKNEEISI
jgi:hypothetical protein